MLFVTQIHQNHNLMAVSLTMLKGINIQTNELSANIGMICSGYVVKSEMVQKKKKKARHPLGKGVNRWEDQKHL